ncbi:putative lipoprotein YqgU [Bacillus velezensis]|nr:putative lipoprotein YqgU [Bacillus velezensis]
MEYDYDQTHKRFYIFKPEGRSYNLISFDLGDERERTVLKNTEMEPIQISPNGEYALYGFTYDRLISLKTGMTEPIITNEKEFEPNGNCRCDNHSDRNKNTERQ